MYRAQSTAQHGSVRDTACIRLHSCRFEQVHGLATVEGCQARARDIPSSQLHWRGAFLPLAVGPCGRDAPMVGHPLCVPSILPGKPRGATPECHERQSSVQERALGIRQCERGPLTLNPPPQNQGPAANVDILPPNFRKKCKPNMHTNSAGYLSLQLATSHTSPKVRIHCCDNCT